MFGARRGDSLPAGRQYPPRWHGLARVPVGNVRSGVAGFFGKFGTTGAGTKAYAGNATDDRMPQVEWKTHQRFKLQKRRWLPWQAAVVLIAIALAAAFPQTSSGQTYRQRLKAAQKVDDVPERIATRPALGPMAAKAPEQGRGEATSSPQPSDPPAASIGQRHVAEAARRVFALPSLQARLRMRVNLEGRQVTAVGQYVQVGGDAEKLLRLDLKFPVASKIGTVQEIRGRDYLWIIKDLPPDEPHIERVILRSARIEIRKAEKAALLSPLEGWMLLGGLSRLLSSLEENFEFGPPREAVLGEIPVLLVRGKWKAASLERLRSGNTPAVLPAQMPHEVELTLAAPGEMLPLFPYRIEFLRRGGAGEGRGEDRPESSLALIEFYEVGQSVQYDPSQFDFDPEEREFDDVTMSYLRKLGLMPGK